MLRWIAVGWVLCAACAGGPESGAAHAPGAGGGSRGEPASAAPTGFTIDSEPSGAQVWLDGLLRGTTPIRVDDLNAGSYRVRLEYLRFQPWEVQLALGAGRMLHLAPVRLRGEISFVSEPDPIPPLPRWPRAPFPSDFEVIVSSSGMEWAEETTVRAHGPDSGEATRSVGRDSPVSCTTPIGARELARFGWGDFVKVIETGQERWVEPERDPPPEDATGSDEVSLRAFGHSLSHRAIRKHALEAEIIARVDAMLAGIERPSVLPYDTFRPLDAALAACLHEGSSFTVELAMSGSGQLRLIAIEPRPPESALACADKVVAQNTVRRDGSCDGRVTLTVHGRRPPVLLNPNRR